MSLGSLLPRVGFMCFSKRPLLFKDYLHVLGIPACFLFVSSHGGSVHFPASAIFAVFAASRFSVFGASLPRIRSALTPAAFASVMSLAY